jgi:hypothetical protein
LMQCIFHCKGPTPFLPPPIHFCLQSFLQL